MSFPISLFLFNNPNLGSCFNRVSVTCLDSTHTTLPTGTDITIDGVALANGSTVLFTHLSVAAQNVIYIAVKHHDGTFAFVPSNDSRVLGGNSEAGDLVYVLQGTIYANQLWAFDGTTWQEVTTSTFGANTSLSNLASTAINTDLLHASDGIGNHGTVGPGFTGANLGPFTIAANQGDGDNGYFITSTNLDNLGFVQNNQGNNNIILTYLTGANAGVVSYASYTTGSIIQSSYGGPNLPGLINFAQPFPVSSGDTVSITNIPAHVSFQQACGVLGGVTFTARNLVGSSGNGVVVQFLAGATAGQEYVTQSGTTVTVHIANGTTTEAGVIAAFNSYGLANAGGSFNPAILVTPQLTDSGAATVTAGSVTLANGVGSPQRSFSIHAMHSLIIDADSRFTPGNPGIDSYAPSKLQVGPLTIQTGGYPTSPGNPYNSGNESTLYLGNGLTSGANGTNTNAIMNFATGISLGNANINQVQINGNVVFTGMNGYNQPKMNLLWNGDLSGDIGSPDGGSTMQRPSCAWLGTALHINGNTASACLEANSTTKGFLPPCMTTVQKAAIASPAAGLMVFDTTLAKLCVYNGSAWQTVTSA